MKIRITPAERPLAQAAGGPVLEREDGLFAGLPCSFLRGSVCSIYPDRYAACRKYSCKLLRGYVDGAVDFDVARNRVAEMWRRVDAVRAAAQAVGARSADRDFFARAARYRDLPDRAERESMARAQVTVVAYNLYADRYFRNRPDPLASG